MILYAYVILLAGSFLAFNNAPILVSVILPAVLLSLATVAKDKGQRVLTIQNVASAANALVFALVAYGIGRGVALVLGT